MIKQNFLTYCNLMSKVNFCKVTEHLLSLSKEIWICFREIVKYSKQRAAIALHRLAFNQSFLKYRSWACGFALKKNSTTVGHLPAQKANKGSAYGRRNFFFLRGGSNVYIQSRGWLNPYRWFQLWTYVLF